MGTASATSMNITWLEWDTSKGDSGDGPVIGYKVFWRYYISVPVSVLNWTSVWVNSSLDLSYTVVELKSYTVYEVAVAAVRPGPGGLGQLSPAALIVTTREGNQAYY